MNFLGLVMFFLSVLALGGVCLFLLPGGWFKKSLFFQIPLAYGLGIYLVTIQLFLYLFVFKFSFDLLIFAACLGAEIILLVLILRRRRGLDRLLAWSRPNLSGFSRSEKILLAFILFFCLSAAMNGLIRPTVNHDSLTMWAYKAKVMQNENQVVFDPDSAYYLGGGGHRHYPWQIPLSIFWLFQLSGGYNEIGLNFIFVAYYLLILSFVYAFLKERLSRFYSLLFVLFLTSMPLFFYHAHNAYADLPLAFYVLLSLSLWYSWLKRRQRADLLLSGVFLGLAVWTKDTGVVYLIAAIIALAVYSFRSIRRIRQGLEYLFYAVLPILPWLWFKAHWQLGVSNVDSGMGFHYQVIQPFFSIFFIAGSWNIWWFAVLAVLVYRRDHILHDKIAWAWLAVFLYIGGTFLLYLFTERYVYALDNTALSRNILVILPATFILAPLSLIKGAKAK